MIVSILAYSSCDRSKGNPGEVGPIRFRYDSTGQARVRIDTEHRDLPNALRALAASLENAGILTLLEGVVGGQFKIDALRAVDPHNPPIIITSHTGSLEELERLEELVSRPDVVVHERWCRLGLAIKIPCKCADHGRVICPDCDPCTCDDPPPHPI